MKRLLTILLLMLLTLLATAQSNNAGTLKFMGIPIDGTKENMITQLKAKGFWYDTYDDCLKGQFNGKNVEIYVVTNHNVVHRIYVAYPLVSESQIITEYNILLGQFNRNNKYIADENNKMIPSDENLSYEMTVRNKKYNASFTYVSPDLFSEEEIDQIHQLNDKMTGMSFEEIQAMEQTMSDSLQINMTQMMSLLYGNVWFTIHERYGKYQIGIYYDNLKNRPNGEDL